MKALIFDPSSGASGDMIMGCLLDLGADPGLVRRTVESVGCDLEVTRVRRGHLAATRATVVADARYHGLEEALEIIKGSGLVGRGLERALEIMDVLASAEAKVHGVAKEEARFHEIGALDALADIAGCVAALDSLGVERVYSLAPSVGSGTVSTAHGLLPVPAPATLEVLKAFGIPWKGGPVEAELLTPTGASILSVVVDRFIDHHPEMRAESVGYGSGKRETGLPNVLRGIVGKTGPHSNPTDQVVQLETNVDDVTGEVLGNLIELLVEAGALDVSVIPAVMKKGRSGNVIRALARYEDMREVSMLIMRETGSLGVRVFPSIHRYVAEREIRSVEVELKGSSHRASVKVSRLDGELLNVKAEYEDCKRLANQTKMPLRSVIKLVEEVGWKALDA